mmetsp:Transcript_96579/g.181616  ORF Transcript_96579/g.181616 Transcript_96579/m.181616 type:complete len:407 (+) Transcript_96579:144-1364(+)
MGQASSCTPDHCTVPDRCCTQPVPDRMSNTVKVDMTRLVGPDIIGKENTLPCSLISNAATPDDAAGPPCPVPIKAAMMSAHLAPKCAAELCAEHQDDTEIQLKPADGITAYAQTLAQVKGAPLPSLQAENCRSWEDGWLGASRVVLSRTPELSSATASWEADVPLEKEPTQEGTRSPVAELSVTYDELDMAHAEDAARAYEGVKLNSQTICAQAAASTCSPTASVALESKCRQSTLTWATINEHVITSMSTSEAATTEWASQTSPYSGEPCSQRSSPDRSSRMSSRGSSANLPSPAASWSTSHSAAQSPNEERMLEAQSLLANMLQLSSEAAPAGRAGRRGRSRRRKSAPPATPLGETTSAKGNRRNMSCESKETSLQPINGRMPRFPAAEKLTPAHSNSRWTKRS